MFWLSILFSREPSNAVWLQIFFHNLLFFLELLPSSLYTNTHTSPWRVCTVKLTPIFPQRSTTIYLRTVYWENGNNETLWGPVGHCIQVNPGPQRHRASSYHLHPSTHIRERAQYEVLAKVWLTVRVHRPTSWSFLWSPRDMLANGVPSTCVLGLVHLWAEERAKSQWSVCIVFPLHHFKPSTYTSGFTILCPLWHRILPSPFEPLRGVTCF